MLDYSKLTDNGADKPISAEHEDTSQLSQSVLSRIRLPSWPRWRDAFMICPYHQRMSDGSFPGGHSCDLEDTILHPACIDQTAVPYPPESISGAATGTVRIVASRPKWGRLPGSRSCLSETFVLTPQRQHGTLAQMQRCELELCP